MSDQTSPARGRFRVHFPGNGRDFRFDFLDGAQIIESGEATSLRVIMVLYEEFKRGRRSQDAG